MADVTAAAECLRGWAVRTPLLEYPALNTKVGGRILLKVEALQRTGSFKFRGAYNLLSQLSATQRPPGVVAYSSGNHAQGVAAAARLLGLPAVIVMPADAPAIKIANTRRYGAEVVLYDRYTEDRAKIAAAICAKRGATLVRPYDDPRIIAGQGTVGLEIIAQAAALETSLDALLVSCGGGGLIAGCALAFAEGSPATQLFAVEPEQFDDTRRSLAAGRRLSNDPAARSICDALLVETPGRLTFAINRRYLAGGLTVSDEEVRAAMAYAFHTLKLVVEPGGVVTLAAILADKLPVAGRTMGIVLSGGNVDPSLFAGVITPIP